MKRFWVITFADGTVYRHAENVSNVKYAIDIAILNCNGQSDWDVIKAEAKEVLESA